MRHGNIGAWTPPPLAHAPRDEITACDQVPHSDIASDSGWSAMSRLLVLTGLGKTSAMTSQSGEDCLRDPLEIKRRDGSWHQARFAAIQDGAIVTEGHDFKKEIPFQLIRSSVGVRDLVARGYFIPGGASQRGGGEAPMFPCRTLSDLDYPGLRSVTCDVSSQWVLTTVQ